MAEENEQQQSREAETNEPGEASQLTGQSEHDIQELFKFDPFAETEGTGQEQQVGKAKGSGSEQQTREGKGSEGQQTQQESTEGASQEGSEAAQQGTESKEERLEREARELRERLARLEGQQSAQQQQQTSEQQKGPESIQTPDYNFEVPDEMVQTLTSGDESSIKQTLASFAQGIAQNVHRQTVYDMSQRMGKALPQYLQQVQGQQSQQEQIRQDFFTQYPELQRQEIMPVIEQVATQVQQETGIQDWNPTLRDAIGKRVREVLNIQPQSGNGGQQTSPGTGNGQNPPERPAAQTGGAKATPSGGASGEQRDIMDVVFGR